jgi:ABC-three component (ABC-3C) system Middle Component 6
MLLPDKHITLAESLLGLGSFVLSELRTPKSVDQLFDRLQHVRETPKLPAFHDIDSLLLAVVFLYIIGAIALTENGDLLQCAS